MTGTVEAPPPRPVVPHGRGGLSANEPRVVSFHSFMKFSQKSGKVHGGEHAAQLIHELHCVVEEIIAGEAVCAAIASLRPLRLHPSDTPLRLLPRRLSHPCTDSSARRPHDAGQPGVSKVDPVGVPAVIVVALNLQNDVANHEGLGIELGQKLHAATMSLVAWQVSPRLSRAKKRVCSASTWPPHC